MINSWPRVLRWRSLKNLDTCYCTSFRQLLGEHWWALYRIRLEGIALIWAGYEIKQWLKNRLLLIHPERRSECCCKYMLCWRIAFSLAWECRAAGCDRSTRVWLFSLSITRSVVAWELGTVEVEHQVFPVFFFFVLDFASSLVLFCLSTHLYAGLYQYRVLEEQGVQFSAIHHTVMLLILL